MMRGTRFRSSRLLSALGVGCELLRTQREDSSATAGANTLDASGMLLSAEPEEAQDVIANNAQNDEPVVIVGRIGGSLTPWVEGRAAFSIVDRSSRACSDIEGDERPSPWDYCCANGAMAPSQVRSSPVYDQERRAQGGCSQAISAKELQTVVVQGKCSATTWAT